MGFTGIIEERSACRKKVMKTNMDPELTDCKHMCTPEWDNKGSTGLK